MGQRRDNQLINNNNYIEVISSYIIGVYDLINSDIDEEYYILLEKALEYGMTINEFWDNDIEYYYCYENAYLNKIHNIGHTQGLYNFEALSIALSNMFVKSKNDIKPYLKDNYYSLYLKEQEKKVEYFNQNKKVKLSTKEIKKENLEEQYRLRLAECY